MSRKGAGRRIACLAGALLVSSLGCGAGAPPGGVTPSGEAGSGAAGTSATGTAGTTSLGPLSGDLDMIDGQGCPALLSEDELREYALDIGADDWAKLDAEFHDIQAVLSYMAPKAYHPATFHFGMETVAAAVRLKGQSSWVDTISFDATPKMQFVVAFDQQDPNGKFHGLSKIVFDMPRVDWTFLNERVANAWLRRIGILAPCTNSARLSINGAYYGLYAAEENVGDRLLKRFFPGNAGGDLFKHGHDAETNEASPNWTRLQTFWDAKDPASVSRIVDIPRSLATWATEAILNDSDGYYGGSHNFYIYDQGASGYVFLPGDVDSTMEWMSVFTSLGSKQHPIFWWEKRPFPQPPGQHYLVVMNDPGLRAAYVDAVDAQLAKWDSSQIVGWLDAWSKQVAGAVADDPHKWATVAQFHDAVAAARAMATARPEYLRSFVSCERGMDHTDADGDGVPWCNDCRDDDPAIKPGAAEVCGNLIDDNCNGVVDENCPGEMPSFPGQAMTVMAAR